MRVIAGEYRGYRLRAPREGSLDVRPTADRVKEAMFSALSPYLEGATVLDLFAGTGSLGIEALSRGSTKAYFCDSSKSSIALVTENIRALGIEGKCCVLAGDYARGLSRIHESIDIIFIDAPYFMCEYGAVLRRIAESGVTASGCVIVLERDKRAESYELPPGMNLTKTRRYGNTEVDFIEVRGEAAEGEVPGEGE
jgi:16S rRNA (guanine(966)-N(2))-methyltransferase RsmD